MGKYLAALKEESYKTPNQAPEFTEKLENPVFSGGYLKHSENSTAEDRTDKPPGDQLEAADQPTVDRVPASLSCLRPRKWLERLNPKSKNPETWNLRPEFTELSTDEISETRRQLPEFTEKSNNSVFSGGYLHKMSADEFLTQVTKGLRVGVKELLRLGIITQQDITDLENGMYGFEHVDAYRALVKQQLTLRLAPGGKEL